MNVAGDIAVQAVAVFFWNIHLLAMCNRELLEYRMEKGNQIIFLCYTWIWLFSLVEAPIVELQGQIRWKRSSQ